MTIPSSIVAPLLFALGCGMLTAILLRRSYRYFGKKRRPQPALAKQARPQGQWSGAQADAAARLNRQEVELHELGRDITARIDSKMILLQELLNKSQAQIDRLETLLAQAEETEPHLQQGEV